MPPPSQNIPTPTVSESVALSAAILEATLDSVVEEAPPPLITGEGEHSEFPSSVIITNAEHLAALALVTGEKGVFLTDEEMRTLFWEVLHQSAEDCADGSSPMNLGQSLMNAIAQVEICSAHVDALQERLTSWLRHMEKGGHRARYGNTTTTWNDLFMVTPAHGGRARFDTQLAKERITNFGLGSKLGSAYWALDSEEFPRIILGCLVARLNLLRFAVKHDRRALVGESTWLTPGMIGFGFLTLFHEICTIHKGHLSNTEIKASPSFRVDAYTEWGQTCMDTLHRWELDDSIGFEVIRQNLANRVRDALRYILLPWLSMTNKLIPVIVVSADGAAVGKPQTVMSLVQEARKLAMKFERDSVRKPEYKCPPQINALVPFERAVTIAAASTSTTG